LPLTGGEQPRLRQSNFYLVTLEILELEAGTQPMSVKSKFGRHWTGRSAAGPTTNRIDLTPPAGTTRVTLRPSLGAPLRTRG